VVTVHPFVGLDAIPERPISLLPEIFDSFAMIDGIALHDDWCDSDFASHILYHANLHHKDVWYNTSSISKVMNAVMEATGIPYQMYASTARGIDYNHARMIFAFLCKQFIGLSTRQIGQILGGRDHTTIMHALENYDFEFTHDRAFQKNADAALKRMSGK